MVDTVSSLARIRHSLREAKRDITDCAGAVLIPVFFFLDIYCLWFGMMYGFARGGLLGGLGMLLLTQSATFYIVIKEYLRAYSVIFSEFWEEKKTMEQRIDAYMKELAKTKSI